MDLFSKYHTTLFSFAFIFFAISPFYGQRKKRFSTESIVSFPEKAYEAIQYRSIGPYRGGRSAAVTGVPGKPNLYFISEQQGEVSGKQKMEDKRMRISLMVILEEVLAR